MPQWDVDFSDIESDSELPVGISAEEDDYPEGWNEEFAAVEDFLTDNLERAAATNDMVMVDFVVEESIVRYNRLGLNKLVLDKEVWNAKQLGKGIKRRHQQKVKELEIQTQIAYMEELIADQKKRQTETRGRVAVLRAELDAKKVKLDSVNRYNSGILNEIRHINKRHSLIQERIRLDTFEYDREKSIQDDLRETFTQYSADLDRQLLNAPWLIEQQQKAARKKELEEEVASLEADIAKLDLIKERNRLAEESERELPFQTFCVKLAELYVKRAKMEKALEEEKQKVKKKEEEKRNERALEDSSQMDCTQAMLDADLDDEETLMRVAKHYKIDTTQVGMGAAGCTQQTQLQSQLQSQLPPARAAREQSPADSSASSEAVDMDQSTDSMPAGATAEAVTKLPPPAVKRVSIVIPALANPDESVDEAVGHKEMPEDDPNESRMEEEEEDDGQQGDRSQPEQMEIEERGEEEEEEEDPAEIDSQESGVDSQENAMVVEQQEEQADDNDGFLRPAAPVIEEEHHQAAAGEEEASFNPEMLLNMSSSSNDPGNDFFNLMNNESTKKRAAIDAAGGSPTGNGGAGDADFMSMFGGGGDAGTGDGDAPNFSFNFAQGGDAANDTTGGGGEFNFFGF